MTALNDRFWAKVLFSQFIKHYRKMTPEQKVADIDASMDALEDLDDTGDSFGAKMVRWSMERVNQYPQAIENGKKGGRPRKNQETTADAPTREDGDVSATDSNISGTPEARQSQKRAGASSLSGGLHSVPVRTSGRKFRNKEEFMEWAIDKGLDASDASDCWEATVERGWKDADGNAVKNMEAFAMQWCKTSESKRRSA